MHDFFSADITAGFNFTMLQGAEGTTVMVCADIMSSMTFNVSITFSVANTEPSEISKLTTSYSRVHACMRHFNQRVKNPGITSF